MASGEPIEIRSLDGPPNEIELEPRRSTSAEPLLDKDLGPPAERTRQQPPVHMNVEDSIRKVLITRPSIRMASRRVIDLSPLHDMELSPLHDQSMSRPESRVLKRSDPTRHTLPSRVSTASTITKTPKKSMLLKPFLSSISLGGNGLPLKRANAKTAPSPVSPVSPVTPVADDSSSDVVIGNTNVNHVELTRVVVQDLDRDDEVLSPISTEPENLTLNHGTFDRGNELRKSTMLLKDRLLKHRQTMDVIDMNEAVQAGCIANWRYVKWPKVKSWLQVQLSRRLWNSHLKEVEGHFGTAVVSYFIFLRWLFIMNLLIFTLWFSIICLPQIIHYGSRALNTTSLASCVFDIDNSNNYSCSTPSAIVYSLQTGCQYEGDTFTVQTCSFDNNVANKESGTEVRVAKEFLDPFCDLVAYSRGESSGNITVYQLCANVDPHFEWYMYLADFISGTGIFNETILFHGVFPNVSVGDFSFDLAFLVMVGIIYVVSVLLLVYKMGHAFNESYVQFGKKRRVNFCNKLFTAWDFNITNPKTAGLKKAHIKTDFKEELTDINAREERRSWKQLTLMVFIRIWTNLFVFVSLIGAGAAIYFSARLELDLVTQDSRDVPFIAEYLSAIVISILNAVYPFVFSLIAQLEQYKTAGERVNATLLRTILVRLSSLLVLLGSLYNVISQCTRAVDDDTDTSECTFSTLTGDFLSNITSSDETCPECWETFIGQQFFRLALTNLTVSLLSTVVIETLRNCAAYLVKKIKHKKLNGFLKKVVKRGNFNIPKSILDLIYTQSLLWLGFLFSPLLPSVVLLTSFFLFYIKKYSLIYNLEPDKKGFARSAKTNFLFLLLMLLALFASAIPVLYAVTQIRPSTDCGPFRGQANMYESITLLIEQFSCPVQIAVDFFNSAAFVVPLVIVLLLLLYTMYVVLKARDSRFKLIKKQLLLEGANVSHIVGHLDLVLLKLAEEKAKQDSDRFKRYSSQPPNYLDDVIQRYSKAIDKSPVLPHTPKTIHTTVL